MAYTLDQLFFLLNVSAKSMMYFPSSSLWMRRPLLLNYHAVPTTTGATSEI